MAKRAPSSQPRTKRTRVPVGDNPAQAADAAVASTTPTMEPADRTDEILASETGPSEDEIRRRAYERYLERGGIHGQDFDDWLDAERELKGSKSEV